MKKPFKKFVSLFLSVLMLVSVCVPAFADAQPEYIYIGDSMTFNYPVKYNWSTSLKTIYPQQIAEEFGYHITYDDYRENLGKQFEVLCVGGFRSTDLYCALSDYPGDDYTEHEFWWHKNYKSTYQDALDRADVITYQLGYSNMSAHLLNILLTHFDAGSAEMSFYDTELSKLFTPEELERIMPFADKCSEYFLDALDGIFTDELKQSLADKLGQEAYDKLLDTADFLKDAFVYEIVSMLLHFDASINAIQTLNPNAKLFVIGLFNPLSFLKLSLGNGVVIPFGELTGIAYEMLNLYMRVLSPYATSYYFLENEKELEVYADLVAYDEDTAYEVIYSVLNGDLSADKGGNAELARKMLPGVMKIMKNNTIDLPKAIATLDMDVINNFSVLSDAELLKLLAQYCEVDENGELTANYFQQCFAYLYMFLFKSGALVHPTQAGHDKEAAKLIPQMKDPKVDPQALALHETGDANRIIEDALETSSSVGEILESVENFLSATKPADDSPFSFLNDALHSIASTLRSFIDSIRSFLERIVFFC